MRVTKTNKSTLQENKLLHLQEKDEAHEIRKSINQQKVFEMACRTIEKNFPQVLEIKEEIPGIWKLLEGTKWRRVGWMIDKENFNTK